MAHIATGTLMHQPQANGPALQHAGHMHAQAPSPPCGILGSQNGGQAHNRLVLGHAAGADQQADTVHPVGQIAALADRQRIQLIGLGRQLLGHGADFVIAQIPHRCKAVLIFKIGHHLHQAPGLHPFGRLHAKLLRRQSLIQHRGAVIKAPGNRRPPGWRGAANHPLQMGISALRSRLVRLPLLQTARR